MTNDSVTNDSREFAAVRVSLLRAVFDVAVSSMDFSSGFLDDEEVAALRELAAELGVDPATATPHNFMCRYRGSHNPGTGTIRFFTDSHEEERAWCIDCSVTWPPGQDPPSAPRQG